MASNNKFIRLISKKQVVLAGCILSILFGIGSGIVFIILKGTGSEWAVGGQAPKNQFKYKVRVDEKIVAGEEGFYHVFDSGSQDCAKHFPLGSPELNYVPEVLNEKGIKEGRNPLLFCYGHYASAFNMQTLTPIWASHVLSKKNMKSKAYHERSNDFRPDAELMKIAKPYAVTPQMYTRSGYDRGHLAPAADFAYNQKAMSESFIMTNIAPQAPLHNRGIWSRLEQDIRRLIKADKNIQELYITTGVAFYKEKEYDGKRTLGDKEGTLGHFNGIRIPTYFFKVILDPKTGDNAAFLIPNTNQVGNQHYEQFRTSIRTVEKVAGMNLHPKLDKSGFERKAGFLLMHPERVKQIKLAEEREKAQNSR